MAKGRQASGLGPNACDHPHRISSMWLPLRKPEASIDPARIGLNRVSECRERDTSFYQMNSDFSLMGAYLKRSTVLTEKLIERFDVLYLTKEFILFCEV